VRIGAKRDECGLVVGALHPRNWFYHERHVVDPIVEQDFALRETHAIPRGGEILRLMDGRRQLLPCVVSLLRELLCTTDVGVCMSDGLQRRGNRFVESVVARLRIVEGVDRADCEPHCSPVSGL